MKIINRANVVLTKEHLARVVEHFLKHEAFVFDVETMPPGPDAASEDRGEPSVNTVVWISLATEGMAVSIPMGHPNGNRVISKAYRKKNAITGKMDLFPAVFSKAPEQLLPSEVFAALEPLFFDPERIVIAHNATFDTASIAKYYDDRLPTATIHDTLVIQWLLNENYLQYGLKPLTQRIYSVKYDKENVGKKIELHEFYKVAHYAFMDARYTWLLWKRLEPLIYEAGLERVFNLEVDLTPILARMRLTGAPVDRPVLIELQAEFKQKKAMLEADIYRVAKRRFNINSNQQLCEVLYGPKSEGGQGLKPTVLTKGGKKKQEDGEPVELKDYSTAEATLELYEGNPLVDVLLKYGEVHKLLSSFLTAYLGDPEEGKASLIYDGRLHPDLKQYGTVTGRFSCSAPNLQQVPRPGDGGEDDLGRKIRALFMAPPGYKMVVADYDQIEMRLLAHFAGQGALFDGIRNGMDPHSATAAGLIGMDVDEFMAKKKAGDPEIAAARQAAKAINFAIVYGAGPDKVASMAKISLKEAKRFLQIHQETFPEVYRLKAKIIETTKSRRPPHIKTLFGRKRRLPEIFAKNYGVAGRAERQAVNSLIQGSSADITKFAMVVLADLLPPEMHLILSVHDELVVLTPEDRAEECVGYVQEAMLGEHIKELCRVPITSEAVIVSRWSDAK